MSDLTKEQLESLFLNEGVCRALRYAYKNPDGTGYDTPSEEFNDVMWAYETVSEELEKVGGA